MALFFGSIAFALLLGEIGLRLWLAAQPPQGIDALVGRPYDPRRTKLLLADLIRVGPSDFLPYEFVPGRAGEFEGAAVSINTLGLRGPETTVEKPPKTFRIAGLGDSILFGWGVPEEATWLRQLEARLNATATAGWRYEALNFGAPGYNTRMEAECLRLKAMAFAPDLVVVHFCGNDLQPPFFLRERPNYASLGRSFLWERLVVAASGLSPRLARARGGERMEFVVRGPAFEEPLPNPERYPAKYRPLVGVESFREGLDVIAAEANRLGAPAYILRNWGLPGYSEKTMAEIERRNREELMALATDRGLRLVDAAASEREALAALEAARQGDVSGALNVSTSDPHPSRLGHGAIALAMYEALVRDGSLPDAAARADSLDADLAAWRAEMIREAASLLVEGGLAGTVEGRPPAGR